MGESISIEKYGVRVEERSSDISSSERTGVFISNMDENCALSDMGVKAGFKLRTIGPVEILKLADVEKALDFLRGRTATQYAAWQFLDNQG